MKRRPLIAGNWKMNGTLAGAAELAEAIPQFEGVDVVLCPPSPYLETVEGVSDHLLGAQDVSSQDNGAHTGDISVEMLKDLGCSYVIVGHSERRQNHGETDILIAAKAAKSLAGGVIPIICVGETRGEREGGHTKAVIERQIAGSIPPGATGRNIVVAYEPVWAIGTGLVATTDQIAEVHGQIRRLLEKRLADGADLRIIYGGSVKPENAREILALKDVDGALVGGASLSPQSFVEIIKAVQ